MHNKPPEKIDRRTFLKGLIASVGVGSVAGLGGAWWNNQAVDAPSPLPLLPVNQPTIPHLSAQQMVQCDQTELIAQITALQADTIRLQTERDGLQQQLQQIQSNSLSHSEQLESTQTELNIAQARIGSMMGLFSLYDQLDEWGVDQLLADGLTTMNKSMDQLTEQLPAWSETSAATEMALAHFEAQLPIMENGRLWLKHHLKRVQQIFDQTEEMLTNAVELTGPFLEMLNLWFQEILSWLPFGMGNKAGRVMQALTDLLTELPFTLSGLDTNILQPLAVWFEEDDQNEMPLSRKLIKPIRTQALHSLNETTTQLATIHSEYSSNLAEPGTAVLDQRAQIKQQIATYRREYGIYSS